MRIERVRQAGTTVGMFEVPAGPDTDAKVAALLDARHRLDEALLENGAVYVRGLGIGTPEQFRALVDVCSEPLDSYRGGNTPRETLTPGIFTSTEYPAQYEISMHNEMSYAHRWPERLYFSCLVAPDSGGATPVTDGRALLADLDSGVRRRFESRGVTYRQNLHGGFGLGKSWQQTFETDDRVIVEKYLRSADAAFRWDEDDLWVEQVRPAVRTHPVTGEKVWFNQADQWHPSNLPPADAEALLSVVDILDELPHSASYGDGSELPAEDLHQVRTVANRHRVVIPWHPGDLLVIDNMLVLHGREAFSGSRRVIVAMS